MKSKSFVLPLVMLICALILLLGFYIFENISSEFQLSKNANSGIKCFYLAEAGTNEAIWKIKNDESAKNNFLNTDNGITTFSRNTNLIDGSSYQVTIQNTAKGVATITSTGSYQYSSSKTAKRKIKINVAKATDPPSYNHDGAIFTGGGQANSEEDVNIWGSILNIYNSGIISGRDITIKFFSNVHIDKDIKASRNIDVSPGSQLTYGGISQTGITTSGMPSVDFNSTDPNSYKNLAASQNQLFTQQQFNDLMQQGNPTLNGIVYVIGDANIDLGRTLTINGILIAEGSINVGSVKNLGTLKINHIAGKPSGIISMSKILIDRFGNTDITGIVYAGNRVDIRAGVPITITGGILSRDMYLNYRQLDIYFDANLINEALSPSTSDTPVIILNHWEEEY